MFKICLRKEERKYVSKEGREEEEGREVGSVRSWVVEVWRDAVSNGF